MLLRCDFPQVLLKWGMVLPATFVIDPTGGGTWMANSGEMSRYDYVAVSRCLQPFVAAAFVDTNVHLAINLRIDHLVAVVVLHLDPSQPSETPTTARSLVKPYRAALKLQEVRDSICADLASYPPVCSQWTIDDHDRLLAKAFRISWHQAVAGQVRIPKTMDD